MSTVIPDMTTHTIQNDPIITTYKHLTAKFHGEEHDMRSTCTSTSGTFLTHTCPHCFALLTKHVHFLGDDDHEGRCLRRHHHEVNEDGDVLGARMIGNEDDCGDCDGVACDDWENDGDDEGEGGRSSGDDDSGSGRSSIDSERDREKTGAKRRRGWGGVPQRIERRSCHSRDTEEKVRFGGVFR